MNLNHYLSETDKRLDYLREVINGRPVGIFLPAPSSQDLLKRKEDFKKLDICWATVNHYYVIEEQFGQKMDIILRSAKECGVPALEDFEFLERPEANVLITEADGYHHNHLPLHQFLPKYGYKVLWFKADRTPQAVQFPDEEHPLHFFAQQSFSILLCLAIICGAKSVIIFGGEGCSMDDPSTFGALKGWVQSEKKRLVYDVGLMNYLMPTILSNVYRTWKVPSVQILNCLNRKSYYSVFPTYTYEETLWYLSRQPRRETDN